MKAATAAAQRASLVAVLGGVPGVAPSATTPGAVLAGMAWPVWLELRWVTKDRVRGRWAVVVVLPAASHETAVAESDQLVMDVGEALALAGWRIDRAEPHDVVVEGGGQAAPALKFTVEM